MNSRRKFAQALFALMLLCAATAHAQYNVTGVGTAPGGGNVIDGTGALGQLGLVATGTLAPGGFNQITIESNGIATGTDAGTIFLNSPGNMLINSGTILGGSGTSVGAAGFNAVFFVGGSLANESVSGSGIFTGGIGQNGSGAGGGNGGIGILFNGTSTNPMMNITGPVGGGKGGDDLTTGNAGNGGDAIQFQGTLTGGTGTLVIASANGGQGGNGAQGGNGGNGVSFFTSTPTTGINMMATGNVTGGNGGQALVPGNFGGQGGDALNASAGVNASTFQAANFFAGNGGLGTNGGGAGGNAINFSSNDADHVRITFTALANGGNGGGAGLTGEGGVGGNGVNGTGTAGNVTINGGSISAGLGGDGAGSGGGIGGTGVLFTSTDTIHDLNVTMTGNVNGGNGGMGPSNDSGGAGGFGYKITSPLLDNIFLGAASVTAGNGGNGQDAGGFGGTGIFISSTSGAGAGALNNGNLTFTGPVAGGTGGSSTGTSGNGGFGGSGLEIHALLITNSTISMNSVTGGAAGSGSAQSGSGGTAVILDSGSYGNSTVTFTGAVTGGNGGSSVTNVPGGNGGGGFYITSGSPTFGVTGLVMNAVSATGGNGGTGNNGGIGGDGLAIYATSGVINMNLIFTGNIAGGTGGNNVNLGVSGGNGGNGIIITGSRVDTIFLTGVSISGGDGGSSLSGGGAAGGAGIVFNGVDLGMNNVSLKFTGMITGGKGSDSANVSGGNGGEGVSINLQSQMTNTTLNIGGATGGAGGKGSSNSGGAGGDGIFMDAYSFDQLTVKSTGAVTGGNGNAANFGGGMGGNGFTTGTNSSSLTNSTFNFASLAGGNGGSISGTFSSGTAANGGDGFYVFTGSVGNITLTVSGSATGGHGGSAPAGTGGAGGHGMVFINAPIFNSTINGGSAIGGAGGSGITGGAGGNGFFLSTNDLGNDSIGAASATGGAGGDGAGGGAGVGGDGVLLSGDNANNVNISIASITGGKGGTDAAGVGSDGGRGIYITLSSWQNSTAILGPVTGGAGGNGLLDGGNGGDAVKIATILNFNFVTLNPTGNVTGGAGGAGTTGAGGNGGGGIVISSNSPITGFNLTSHVTIAGGNGGTGGAAGTGAGGMGVSIVVPSAANSSLTNHGIIQGGNSGTPTGNAGVGVSVSGNGFIVDNWNAINAGTGATPTSISITGSNNTVILEGHSTAHGVFTATGNANNVLVLHFTGMSPAQQQALIAELNAQGNLQNFTGFFDVRGVHYIVDPMVIQLALSGYEQQPGLTPNEQAIAQSFDSGTGQPGPEFQALFNAIDSGSLPLAAVIDQLSPQKYQLYGDLAISNANFLTLEIDQRLNNLRDGSESIDTSGMSGGSDQPVTAGFSKDEKESKEIVLPKEEKRWGFFASGNGNFFRVDARDVGMQNAKADTAGAVMGIDGKVGENGVIGALAAYNSTSGDLDAQGSHVDITSWSGGLYGEWHRDGFYVNGLAAYTHNGYNSNRVIAIPGFNRVASASTDSNQATANIDGGYDFKLTDRVTVGPIGGLQYVHVSVNGFNESGAGFANLSVGSQDIDSLQSRVGLRADYHLMLDKDLAFAVEIRAAWDHEFLNDGRTLTAGFINQGMIPFNLTTTAPVRETALVGLGVNFTLHDRVTFFADYDLQAGSHDYLQHSVKGGFKVAW